MRHYKNEAWYPGLFDRNSFEDWERDGGTTVEERAAAKAKRLLETHLPRYLDDSAMKLLDEMII